MTRRANAFRITPGGCGRHYFRRGWYSRRIPHSAFNARPTPKERHMSDTWTYHPHPNERGERHRIHAPSCEANLAHIADPLASVTFIPGSACAAALNGVPFVACTRGDIETAGADALAEPPFVLPPGFRAAAGAVVVEPDGRVWLVAPSNGFGGYEVTFPKGRVDAGMPLHATAVREVWEESGLHVALTAWLGDFRRTQTHTRFYLARRIGGQPGDMGWESQAVHLATPARARELLNRSTDQAVLDAFMKLQRT
jgi:ADP-ribose pyrophosphatase YjhB (NUDIX family)